MTKLFVAEFSGVAITASDGAPIAPMPPIAEQVVDYTAGVANSAAFGPNTRLIRVHADSICSINVGSPAANAAITNARMIAGQTEYFGVSPGATISAITNT